MRTPDGSVRLDPTGRLAGRGAYLCPGGGCAPDKQTRMALGRALETTVPPELLAELEAMNGTMTTDERTMTTEGGARGQE